ncbi:WXG100 family type VII secretion target [Microbacterium sp. C5A9]|uniref:WXG100 family type VII secretion target n=1 Tax=Microbacterium sp. C5A9 TaxID=2736663 RepID=UPI001F51897E|nr:WXG100 family type VII secretion target [Microbacterium sp. C5A9]MCI1018874.1 WXG100 family type VII secretion target [Microbacterium sp. C5A9]
MIIRGDFGALDSEAGRLDDVADRIDGRLVAARHDIDDFLACGWTGPAATQFRAAFDRWLDVATGGAAELHDRVEAIREATRDLVASEQANAQVSDSASPGVSDALSRLMGAR